MQKFIVKYGLAAHLTILAVAPLFLYFAFPATTGAIALLWLSLPTALWLFLGPSLRHGEQLSAARRRVVGSLVADPLSWTLLALVVAFGMCASNAGVTLAYDAEDSAWVLSDAASPLLPGSVEGCGFFPFAAMLATAIVVVGVRHSLGKSARTWFLTGVSMLTGIVALVWMLFGQLGFFNVGEVVRADATGFSFVGLTYGLSLLAGTVALVGAIENEWHALLPLLFFCIGGTAAGAFCYSPVYMIVAVFAAELLLVVYAVVYARLTMRATAQLKVLGCVLIFFVLGGLVTAVLSPQDELMAKLDALAAFKLIPDGFLAVRETLSKVALKTWFGHLWLGTGLGSFPIDFRFAAKPEDWALLRLGAKTAANVWWQVLAERGIIGLVLLVLPFLCIVVTYVRRLVGWAHNIALPHPSCLLAVFAVAVTGFCSVLDVSLLRADALSVFFPLLVVSAMAFPTVRVRKGGGNG